MDTAGGRCELKTHCMQLSAPVSQQTKLSLEDTSKTFSLWHETWLQINDVLSNWPKEKAEGFRLFEFKS